MKILAVAEQRDTKFKKSTFEVVRTARTIADQTGGEVIALVIGGQVQAIAGELGGYGAQRVLAVQQPKLEKIFFHGIFKSYCRNCKEGTGIGSFPFCNSDGQRLYTACCCKT